MISTTDIDRLLNGKATVYDKDGDKVGSLSQIYLDDATGEPSWATVNTGLFGMSESFVPLEGAAARGEDLHIGYTKDQIKDAPSIDEDHHLEPAEEDRLYEYYAMQGNGRPTADVHDEASVGHDTGRVGGDTAHLGREDARVDAQGDASMIRSEERLNVGVESQEHKVRLRKYTVTENVTKTVPVTHEEVVVERVPLGEDARPGRIDDDGDVAEMTVRDERAVVDKETVAMEEVRLGKESHTEQEQVSGEIRKERIETEGDAASGHDDKGQFNR
ncbi:MAG: DUF2382 domain-containing protein [Arachnia sp.]